MKITLRASPMGGGIVVLSWMIEPPPTATILRGGTPIENLKAGIFSEVLTGQPVGKTSYQFEDDATGTVSNRAYTTVK